MELVELSPAHHEEITAIFNHYVTTSMAAYPEGPVPVEMMARLLAAAAGFPAVAALTSESRVAGFAMVRPWHPLPTFKRTAEWSCFIAPEHTRQGLGAVMLQWVADRARTMDIASLLASISHLNTASIAFHQRHGFLECGRFREVGCKQGNVFDVVWMQKAL